MNHETLREVQRREAFRVFETDRRQEIRPLFKAPSFLDKLHSHAKRIRRLVGRPVKTRDRRYRD